MNNLSQDCIEQIYKAKQDYYPDLGYDDVITTLESTIYDKQKESFLEGERAALTNPTIYQSAGLMTVEEALRFAEWVAWYYIKRQGMWYIDYPNKTTTTTELLTIFRNQNQ